jgi:hypothetical protein
MRRALDTPDARKVLEGLVKDLPTHGRQNRRNSPWSALRNGADTAGGSVNQRASEFACRGLGVRQLLEIALRGFDFDVRSAANGNEALEIYRRGGIDLVLMDVQMPVLDGPKALARLKEIDSEVDCCLTPRSIAASCRRTPASTTWTRSRPWARLGSCKSHFLWKSFGRWSWMRSDKVGQAYREYQNGPEPRSRIQIISLKSGFVNNDHASGGGISLHARRILRRGVSVHARRFLRGAQWVRDEST